MPQAYLALPAGKTLRFFHVPTYMWTLVLVTPPLYSIILFFKLLKVIWKLLFQLLYNVVSQGNFLSCYMFYVVILAYE